ncbi:MAG: elongation factor P [Parcubacteria group bacterium]|nr:elongation factor P [Parcubacteria group bacterium]
MKRKNIYVTCYVLRETMLSINDLQNGTYIVYENAPYQVLEVRHLHIGRGGSSIQTKLKNLKTGQVLARNFKPADMFEEADVEKRKVKYLYNHRDEYWFAEEKNEKNRFIIKVDVLGDIIHFLKPNTMVEALNFKGEILTITLPIKMDFKVIEAPPATRGNTAQGGTKTVTIETGAQIVVPLFVSEGDIIRINTQTGEYVERVEKGK